MLNRLFYTLCFLIFSTLLFGQGFNDDFSDGNFTSNPTWIGDVAKFQVNAAKQLQLDGSGTDVSYLSTQSKAFSNATWEFYVHSNTNPSGSNYGVVYLVSDNSILTQSLNGYFVRIGGKNGSSDDVSLYRQDGIVSTLLIDGMDGTVGTDPMDLKIKVTRDSLGKWELFIDLSATGNSYVLEGTKIDNTHTTCNYFGIVASYTSTRNTDLYFDDFNVTGQIYLDQTPPKVSTVTVLNSNTLELSFNEFVDTTSARALSNYTVNKSIGNPSSAEILTDSSKIKLTFSTNFLNGEEYEIEIQNIQDRSGNIMTKDTLRYLYFIPQAASYRDIVINEFMADPTPQVGLPDAEFIEIYNASNKIFDLAGWTIGDATKFYTLQSLIFSPGEYLIVCELNKEAAFATYGQTQGQASFITLLNTEDQLILKDNSGNLIDQVNYNDTWYGSTEKKAGGYTLEQINPLSPCTGQSNFKASLDSKGGTPGAQNSVYNTAPDIVPPILVEALITSDSTIDLVFDEVLDELSFDTATFVFSNGNKDSIRTINKPNLDRISLVLSNKLDSGVVIQLSIFGLADCSGNLIGNNTTKIALPQSTIASDIVINEILFNPKTGGSDFVELFNRSEKVISLENWQLANYAYDSISNKTTLFKKPVILYPNEYIVVTKSKSYVVGAYPFAKAERIFEVSSLPSYNDDKGDVYLLDNKGKQIDYLTYTVGMHFPLLKDKEGVTLERVNPDRGTNEQGNFQSAAEKEGFGTPGYLNSQSFTNTSFNGDFTVDPELFSPDNDGYNDIVNFNYQFNAPGYVANVSIFDRQGRLIRNLIKNELLGAKGTFIWDGIKEDGTKANIGIYVVFFEVFNISGDQKIYKKSCVVAGNL